MQLNSLDDMKQFAGHLAELLDQSGYKDKAEMVNDFFYNSFTTSSEYLGEFRIVLNRLIQSDIIAESAIISEIKTAIQAIDRAFGQRTTES